MGTQLERLRDFFFHDESDTWLSILRVGLAIQLLFYAFSLGPDWTYLFASHGRGLISRQASEVLLWSQSDFVPRLSWLDNAGERIGLSENTVLLLSLYLLFAAASLLLLGLFSRTAAGIAWFIHLAAVKSGGLMSYGVDNFTTIGLFYLMVSPLPDQWSLDHRLRGVRLKDRQWHGLFRRILQLHLCLIYFFGGIAKSVGPGWWNGENIWQALTQPPFNLIDPQILVRGRFFFPLVGVLTCLLETGYPIFIWSRRTRGFWLSGICAMHVMIGLTMGMYLFGLIMIILNLAAFGPEYLSRWAASWQRVSARDIEPP